MQHILIKTIRLILISIVISLLIPITFSCARTNDFFAVLIESASKKPVSSTRVILATKKKGERECTINTSLVGISDERGEVRISNVHPGEYVVFMNPSGSIKPELEGKVVTWGRDPLTARFTISLGAVLVTQGTLKIFDGALVISNGYMESGDGNLGICTTDTGELLTVRVPSTGSAPLRIEITTGSGK